jgi:hypothetical protein
MEKLFQLKNMEEIEKITKEISELDNFWDKVYQDTIDGFKDKYGIFIPNISFQALGIADYYKIHCEKRYILVNKIKNEYIKLISSIANSIATENIKPPLIDYNVPFIFIEESGYNRVQPTKVEKIIFYFLTKPVTNLHGLQHIILSEFGFFNQADVIIEKGKSPYQSTIKNANSHLKYYNLIDKKGNITIIGKGVKDLFKKRLAEGTINLNLGDVKFTSTQFINLIFEFCNSNNLEDLLLNLDGKSNLENNLNFLRDLKEKLKTM